MRQAGNTERQQIKWFAYATTVSISGVILKNTLYPALGGTWVWWVGFVLTAVGLTGSPVAMGLANFRYRLYEIDLLINRTLVYGSLTAVLALVYVASVVVLQYDVRKTLEAFSAKLREETDLDALNAELVAVVSETMQPAHVSLWLRPDRPPMEE